jgi:hypothetical protein
MNNKNILYNIIEEFQGEILFDLKDENMLILNLKGQKVYFRIIDNRLRIDGDIEINKKLFKAIEKYLLKD